MEPDVGGKVPTFMVATVIIPAHNEAPVVGRLLNRLSHGMPPTIELVVVANGCTDETASIARAAGPGVRVVEVPAPSKTGAIRAGMETRTDGPVAVVDADVVIAWTDLAALFGRVAGSGVSMVEPTARFDTASATAPVRAFYRVWLALHGTEIGDVGGGVYVLDESAADAVLRDLPDVISDDGYVRAMFAGRSERVGSATSIVVVPRTTSSLVRIKTRSRMGNRQLRQGYPELFADDTTRRSLAAKARRLPLGVWPLVPWYVVVQVWTWLRAKRHARVLGSTWERDTTTRTRDE